MLELIVLTVSEQGFSMRCVVMCLTVLFGILGATAIADARVNIQVDLASQTMHVSSASGDYVWPISSARTGFRTPHGSFGVQRLEVMHRSHKYHNSPMPHSIFFAGGYAIHGTYDTVALGRPASHGCIRLSPGNAAALYRMVQQEGARIAINGSVPDAGRAYADRNAPRDYAEAPIPRHHAHMAGRGGYIPAPALGYAPVEAPTFYQWVNAPTGF